MKLVLATTCLVAAAITTTLALKATPCPEQFQYQGSVDQAKHQWHGTLNVTNEQELQGLWIRVRFDATVKEIVLPEDFKGDVVSRSPSNDEYLIKNPHYVLSPKSPLSLGITVKYDGDKVPSLIGYRLNARTVCPEQNGDPSEIFRGDFNSDEFLSQVLPKTAKSKSFECGKPGPHADHPWQAALSINGIPLCQATLVSPKHLITAAHCVTYNGSGGRLPSSSLAVSFGKPLKDGKAKAEARVAAVHVYPGYKFVGLFNDIAVVELDRAVVVDDDVRPVCLPSGAKSKKEVVVGYTFERSPKSEGKLAALNVEAFKAEECEKRLGLAGSLVSDNSCCVSYAEDASKCVGDSGSPVLGLGDSGWELKGVVTLGVAVQPGAWCNRNSTVLLADVSRYSRWIRQVASF